jgi:hypothetical protein
MGRQAHEALDVAQAPRPASAEVRAHRRADALDAAAAGSTRQLDRLGSALQTFATDLAECQASAASLVERAQAAGLQLRDGALAAQWGVSGVADAQARASQEAARTALQSDLDALTATMAQRRQRLLATLRETQSVVDGQRRQLRAAVR